MAKTGGSPEILKFEGDFLKKKLSKAKAERGLSAKALALDLGVSESLVSQWLSGRTRIPDRTLMALSRRLDFGLYEVRPALFGEFAGSVSIDLLVRLNCLDARKRRMALAFIDLLDDMDL